MAGKRGSKLNKSESVQVRFDPKLKMAVELLAARERRTLSSLVEWAMERTVKELPVTNDIQGKPVTAWQVADDCWDENHYYRIYKLSEEYSDLLTYEENRLSTIMFELRKIEAFSSGAGSLYDTFVIDRWLKTIKIIWPSILEFDNKEIDETELYENYRETRRFLDAKRQNPNIDEIRELIKSDLLNQYPSVKQILEVFLEK